MSLVSAGRCCTGDPEARRHVHTQDSVAAARSRRLEADRLSFYMYWSAIIIYIETVF